MKPSDRSALPAALREAVLSANNGNCTYCTWDTAHTIDHVVPVDEGGRDDVSNLVPACKSCNSSKRNRGVLRWRRDVRARPPVTTLGMFLGERGYHEPDRVMYLDQEALLKLVARVQAEVVGNFQQHESRVAAQLLGDLNRLIARMGNLSPERQGVLRDEARLRLAEQEQFLLADPGERRLALWKADRRQFGLWRQRRAGSSIERRRARSGSSSTSAPPHVEHDGTVGAAHSRP